MNLTKRIQRVATCSAPILAAGLAGCSHNQSAMEAGAAEASSMAEQAKKAVIDFDQSLVDVDASRPKDERIYRAFQLDNGLDVLLVSDPEMQKSAAAMDVAVGSLEDPWDHLGMAHFLEHLLFLGTDKYPTVEEYSEYLANNGGSSNAYTSSERTNYQLQVNHDGLEEALDRFAQFFIAPRFDPEFVEREMNAVNSEHQKNLQDDFWRKRMIQRALHRDGHPRQKFSTGDLSTLENATREALIEFYKKYYSANVMKLCVMSENDLDTMEGWVRSKFASIPNYDRGALQYPKDVFDPAKLPMVIEVKPVTDSRSLELEFAMPSVRDYWREKPTGLLGALVGHEGEGSLLSQLKKEDLATGLSSGTMTESYSSYFSARVTLTENGLANVDRVIQLFFSYVDMLREEGLKDYYFYEHKVMSEIDYYYRDPQEGMWTASSYAASMQVHPAPEFMKNESLFFDYDPDLFAKYLTYIQPDKLRATLIAPDVETDQVEPNYGSEYRVYTAPADRVAKWSTQAAMDAFSYPEPNPFMPTDLSLLPAPKVETGPTKLIDDERGTFWFEQDTKFELPKAELNLRFLTQKTNSSPKDRLLATLYGRVISEGMNEWLYPAIEAGLGGGVSADARGVQITARGYSQRLPDLLAEVAGKLETVTIDEKTFAAIKDEVARDYANAVYDQAYSQTFYEFNNLMVPYAIHRQDYQDMVKSITLDEVRQYASTVLNEAAIEGAAYGNLDGAALKAGIDEAFKKVADRTLAEDQRPGRERVDLTGSTPRAWVFSSKSDNACWMNFVQFGPRDPRREAILRIGASYFKTPFYSEMRTRQQLGYIVFSGALTNSPGQGMYFLIQSGSYPAGELADRAYAWAAENISTVREMTDQEFSELQASIVEELSQTETNMGQRLGTLSYEGTELGGIFDWKEQVSSAVQNLTKNDVANAFEAAFDKKKKASLAIYMDADGAETTKPRETLITDKAAFKQQPIF